MAALDLDALIVVNIFGMCHGPSLRATTWGNIASAFACGRFIGGPSRSACARGGHIAGAITSRRIERGLICGAVALIRVGLTSAEVGTETWLIRLAVRYWVLALARA